MPKPFYTADEGTIYQGDCLSVLKGLPDESVHCCVTSPPYWGLRDYGTATWEGGDDECKHVVGGQVQDSKWEGDIQSGVRPGCDASVCKKCGAVRRDKQLGLEKTPEAYIEKLTDIFREVRRVLRDDGTLWLNLGDSYNGSGGAGGDYSPGGLKDGQPKYPGRKISALKPKDLVGIPWRVAFALQADGWWLRSEIIWHKPNPMPESVTDRPTKSHEQIFLLAKSARYFYDAEAIKDESSESSVARARYNGDASSPNPKNVLAAQSGVVCGTKSMAKAYGQGRNKRSVWTVATQPFSGAHFATFPPKLIVPCIMAGCPEGGIVLDPFFGAGTTGITAYKLGRKFIGIELNEKYLSEIAVPRVVGETRQLKLFSN